MSSKKKGKDLKKNDVIVMGGEKLTVESVEVSDIGKHGSQKCRVEAIRTNGEKVVLIRPADYPFSCE